MNMKMDKPMRVAAGACDHRGVLSVPAIFSLFMDIASEHADSIGLGADYMSQHGCFWLTVHTKIRIYDRPAMLDDIVVSTWPEKPSRIRCNRYYTITAADKVLAEGKNEWAIMDIQSGKIKRTAEIYPEGKEHITDVVCAEPFTHFSSDFADAEVVADYKIRSTDIDFGHHMNNVAYVKAFFGIFSCAEMDAMEINEVEVLFKSQSFEGDVLTIRRREAENGTDYGMIRENGEVAAIIRIS